jgi:hypothetical protein
MGRTLSFLPARKRRARFRNLTSDQPQRICRNVTYTPFVPEWLVGVVQ